MLDDLGLVLTVAICGWIALDLLTSTGWRRRALSVAVMALAAGVWATGDLLVVRAESAADALLARRINYLGICALPVAWIACAAQAAQPAWWRRGRRVVLACCLPAVFTYSSLYWPPELRTRWLTDWGVVPHARGPLFWAHVVWAWSLIVLGWVYFMRAALRLRRAHSLRMAGIAIGSLTPLLGNAAYVFGAIASDPTPVLLGFGALVIRLAVVDSGLALYLPLARSEVIEQVEVGIAVADLEGRIVDANRAARRLVGDRTLVGRCLEEAVAQASRRDDLSVEVRTFPLRSAGGVVGTAALFADRTEANHAERRLALAARLEALGFLTAGIAHEVNNPLAFIRANLSQLEKVAHELGAARSHEAPSPETQALLRDASEIVADTQEGVERIAQLVARLRTFARSEPTGAARPVPVELARVAEAAAAMAGVGLPEGSIRTHIEPAPTVRAVEGELVQVALNLLVNAVQASPGTPEIEIWVGCADGGAVLCVRDRGPGLSEDVLPRVFDPFFTTKPPGVGTGLGLSLSYDLARRNGGRLEAANRPGGGAEFTLWLPVPS